MVMWRSAVRDLRPEQCPTSALSRSSKAGKCLTGATFAFLRQDLHARWQFFSVQNPYLFYLDTFSALVPNLLEPEAR
jgi:hypothetical protein